MDFLASLQHVSQLLTLCLNVQMFGLFNTLQSVKWYKLAWGGRLAQRSFIGPWGEQSTNKNWAL